MAENSNFSSFFEGDSEIDIVSSVSDKVQINPIPFSGVAYYGRYFYLGNLLIQFTSVFPTFDLNSGNEFTFNFPKAYTSTPYCIMACPVKDDDDNFNLFITVVSFDTKEFTIHVGNNDGNFYFVAIGPR
jgi:hypothetical protein